MTPTMPVLIHNLVNKKYRYTKVIITLSEILIKLSFKITKVNMKYIKQVQDLKRKSLTMNFIIIIVLITLPSGKLRSRLSAPIVILEFM